MEVLCEPGADGQHLQDLHQEQSRAGVQGPFGFSMIVRSFCFEWLIDLPYWFVIILLLPVLIYAASLIS